jgi:hypothetical protein
VQYYSALTVPACPQEVENRRALRARKAAAAAAGHEPAAGAAMDGASNAAAPSSEADQDEGGEEDGVGPGVAYSQVRQELRQKIVALEDKLQVWFSPVCIRYWRNSEIGHISALRVSYTMIGCLSQELELMLLDDEDPDLF